VRFTDSGDGNSFFGHDSGNYNSSGGFNTTLGDNADVLSGGLTNATAIGANALVGQSNSLVLGSIAGLNTAAADTNVGIGTVFPSTKFHISGSGILRARINSDSNAGVGLALGELSKWSVATVSPGHFHVFNDALGQNALFISTSDNSVGIGTTSPASRLDVNGIITVGALGGVGLTSLCRNGSGQIASCASSARYKTDLADFKFGLELLRRLRPVTFTWRNEGIPDFGLVAEEVAAVEPLLVTRNDEGQPEGVKYDRVGVVAVNAINEQQLQIEAQQKQILEQAEIIRKQTERLDRQQSEIDALRTAVCSQNAVLRICEQKER
jgi:hypothetical protein